MEQYIVSARKYRPSTFGSVVGQKALTATLKNAVATGRLAHSYLFCGPRGVGKTSCARIFAKTINCTSRTPDGEACNECDSCRDFNRGTSLNIIELDAASHNGVDDIRELVKEVMVPPANGRYRVFIIDEVHMLSGAAFNAFLKTLEEPPAHVVFILATTEKHKIIPTILSRCQIYDFHRITIQDMIEHLQYVGAQEGITAEPAALNVIARKADGAMRDALSIFDQVAASARGNITYRDALDNLNVLDTECYTRLAETMLSGDITGSWVQYRDIRERGFDSQFFLNGLAQYMRDLMVAHNPATATLIETGDDERHALEAVAAKCPPDWLYRALCLCNDADLNYRAATSKQLLIEITLAKICQLAAPQQAAAPVQASTLQPIGAATAAPATPAAPAATAAPKPQQAAPAAPPAAPPAPRTAAPAPVPAATRRPAAPAPHMSIHGTKPSAPAAADTPKEAAPGDGPAKPPAALDPDKVRQVWEAYMEANPREALLCNNMRLAMPVAAQDAPGTFDIPVPQPTAKQVIEAALPDICAMMERELGSAPVFRFVVAKPDAAPHTLSDREVMRHLYTTQPNVKRFVDTLKLKLD